MIRRRDHRVPRHGKGARQGRRGRRRSLFARPGPAARSTGKARSRSATLTRSDERDASERNSATSVVADRRCFPPRAAAATVTLRVRGAAPADRPRSRCSSPASGAVLGAVLAARFGRWPSPARARWERNRRRRSRGERARRGARDRMGDRSRTSAPRSGSPRVRSSGFGPEEYGLDTSVIDRVARRSSRVDATYAVLVLRSGSTLSAPRVFRLWSLAAPAPATSRSTDRSAPDWIVSWGIPPSRARGCP